MLKYTLLISSFLLALAWAEIVNVYPCSKREEAAKNCVVGPVNVEPCPQATSGAPCRLKKGKTSSLSFNFTPDFSAEALTNRGYSVSLVADLPFIGQETDACLFTTCPVKKGETYFYNYTLSLGKDLPGGSYDVKWKIFDKSQQDNKVNFCCFIYKIRF